MGKFIIYNVSTGIKFCLKSSNGEVIAHSEVYKSLAACKRGIESVCKSVLSAKLSDLTMGDGASVSNPKFQLYTDKAGAYRFRLVARNGKTVAVSEGYTTKAACISGMESIRYNAVDGEIERKTTA